MILEYGSGGAKCEEFSAEVWTHLVINTRNVTFLRTHEEETEPKREFKRFETPAKTVEMS